MNDAPKKRPWFQYHLSTAIVLMFVASGLLWLNMQPHGFMYCIVEDLPSGGGRWLNCFGQAYGWPFVCWYSHPGLQDGITVKGPMICLDAASALCLLLPVAFTLEWRIRRKERRRE